MIPIFTVIALLFSLSLNGMEHDNSHFAASSPKGHSRYNSGTSDDETTAEELRRLNAEREREEERQRTANVLRLSSGTRRRALTPDDLARLEQKQQ